MMSKGTLLYAQSGGVTAVINATASAVISTARAKGIKVLAARNGILGALREDLIDTTKESAAAIAALAHTPGGAFGSCRYKLKSLEADRGKYERLLEVLRAHDVRWFLYNGGNDSADTAWKVSQLAKAFDYDLTCIGVPKTIDNDLAVTDTCPGFGSAAKYTAVSVREAALDVAAMAETSTKVFVYEAMGRHAGWLAAAAGLAGEGPDDAPHIILLPERAYDEAAFLAKVKQVVERVGHCVVVASEGIRTARSWPMPAAARIRSATPSWAAWPRSWPRGSRTRWATRCTGPCPTTCSARRATLPPGPTGSRRRRWARRRGSSR